MINDLYNLLNEKKPSKIILEGVDGSGKNYLIDKIIKKFPDMNYSVVKCDRHTPNTYEFFEYLLLSDKNIIFNRAMYGQFIYQNREDRINRNWMTTSELLELEDIMNGTNIQVIYVKSDLNNCLFNSKLDNDDSYYTLEYLEELSFKYKYFFNNISQLDNDTLVKYNNDYELDIDIINKTEKRDFQWNENSLPKIAAVDFDQCLVKGGKFPEIGKINEKLRYELFEGKYKDYKKILWTCRDEQNLIDAVTFCQDNNMYFDEYNRNIEEVRKMTDRDTRKVYADVYIDDKALNDKDI